MFEDAIREMIDDLDGVGINTTELDERLMGIIDTVESYGEVITDEIVAALETDIFWIFRERAAVQTYALQQLDTIVPFFERYRMAAINLAPMLDSPPKAALASGPEEHRDMRSFFDEIVAELYGWIPVEWLARHRTPLLGDKDTLGLPPPREIARILMGLNSKALYEGLLALEDDLDALPPVVARFIERVTDGWAPKMVDMAIERHVSYHRRTLNEYEELLRSTLRLISEGENPHTIEVLANEPYQNHNIGFDSTYKMDLPQRSDRIALGEVLQKLADTSRESGARGVLDFSSDHLPRMLQNLPELIAESMGQPDLAEYLIGRYFSVLANDIFYSEQVCRNLIDYLLQGLATPLVEQFSEIVCAAADTTPRIDLSGDDIATRVLQCTQPLQALLAVEEYALALSDYIGVLQHLRVQTDDPGIADWVTKEIETRTTEDQCWDSVPAKLAIREEHYIEHARFLREEEEAKQRVTKRINRLKVEQSDDHRMADSQEIEQLTRFLLETYVKRKKEEARVVAERRTAYTDLIRDASREILGQRLEQVFPEAGGGSDLELTLAERIFPSGPSAMADMIRDLFPDEHERGLFFDAYLTLRIEDIAKCGDRSIEKILLEINLNELSLALTGADEDVVTKIMSRMTPLRQVRFRDALDENATAPAVAIHGARDAVLLKIRRLEKKGEIILIPLFDDDDFSL